MQLDVPIILIVVAVEERLPILLLDHMAHMLLLILPISNKWSFMASVDL